MIRVFVERRREDLAGRIPETIEGYPVEIEESGPIQAL